jgi:hypothetical protein
MPDRQEYQRGFIYRNNEEIPAVRFSSGIVHEFKSRRGVRVSRHLAATFKTKESDSNDEPN